MMKLDKLPGKLENILDIPLAITEEHQHCFPYWYFSGIKETTLVHVDSHTDLADNPPKSFRTYLGMNLPKNYFKKLDIGNFICPAVHYGIIKEIFWISPFWKDLEGYIQHFNGDLLKTKENLSHIKWEDETLSEENEYGVTFSEDKAIIGNPVTSDQFRLDLSGDYVLDIDLDAFVRKINGSGPMFQLFEAFAPHGFGINGWENRIKETMELLKGIPKPKLITLTRSRGEISYTPNNLVLLEEVQEKVISNLEKLYN